LATPLDTSLPGPQLAVRAPPYQSWLLSVLLTKHSDRRPQLMHNVKYASIIWLLSSLLHFLEYKIFSNTALVHMHWEYLKSFWTLEVHLFIVRLQTSRYILHVGCKGTPQFPTILVLSDIELIRLQCQITSDNVGSDNVGSDNVG
jgi:hypothetical protein